MTMDELIRLIIATDNKEYGASLTASLSASRSISVLSNPNSGNELVEHVKLMQPDIILSDLLLAHKDAIASYKEIVSLKLNKTPALFLLIPYNSDSITAEALEAGAAKVIMKPCDIDVLIDKILNYKSCAKNAEIKSLDDANIEIQVTNIMHRIGVPAHINGYHFLRAAIILAAEDMKYVNSVTKILYPEVARLFDTSASRVERAMRHAVEVAWDRGDVDVLNSFFGYTVSHLKGKPTNSEFISLIADHIRLKRKLG